MNTKHPGIAAVLLVVLISFFCPAVGLAAEITETFDLTGPTWHFGDPSDQTYMSPWLPPASIGVRVKMGFRLAGNWINIKCPMRVTIKYDPDKIIAGQYNTIKIKAEPIAPASGKSFESAFGIYLPNTLQVGLVGIPGVPDSLLPWTDIDYNLWDLLGFVPKVGSMLSALKDQIGVNMASDIKGGDNILPLARTNNVKEYHDTRTLIDVTSAVLNDDVIKNGMINKVREKIPASLLKAAETALTKKKVNEYIGKGIDNILGLASIKIEGDPSYAVEGQSVHLMVNFQVPGKTNGDYPVTLTDKNQFEDLRIHIPYFAKTTDNLIIDITQAGYHFRLYQNLIFNIVVPYPGKVEVANVHKTVTQTTITQNIPMGQTRLSIPIKENPEAVGDFHVGTGCISATAFCASKTVQMRCDVSVLGPANFQKSYSESTFKNAHAIPLTGLTANTNYTATYTCADAGNQYATTSPSVQFKTKEAKACEGSSENATFDDLTMSNLQFTPDKRSITITWTTNRVASTEIFLSPSPDLKQNYVSYVKKSGGITAGYFDAVEGDRELVTSHTITVPDLDPDTVYYFIARSWTFDDNDPVKNPSGDVQVGMTAQTQTLPDQSPVSMKALVKSGQTALANIPVKVTKVNDSAYSGGADTNAQGLTPSIYVERGSKYTFSVSNHPCYEDAVSSQLSIPSNAAADMGTAVTLSLTKRPGGGFIVDEQGAPVAGALVKIPSLNKQANTNPQGFFTFADVNQAVDLTIEKAGYLPAAISGQPGSCGTLYVPQTVLPTAAGTMTFTVKDSKGKKMPGVALHFKKPDGTDAAGVMATNAQGKATFTYTFPDAQPIDFIVRIGPSSSNLKIVWQDDTFTLAAGMQSNAVLFAQVDDQAPQISDFGLYPRNNEICLKFNSSEDVTYNIEYKNPNNQTTLYPGSGTSTYVRNVTDKCINLMNAPLGLYKMKIKARDNKGNDVETDFSPIYWQGASPRFGFTIGAKSYTTLELKWTYPWPNPSEFGKYLLALDSPVQNIEVTDYLTTSYNLTNLGPGQMVCGTFKVLSKTGDQLYILQVPGNNPNRFCVSTQTHPPEIKSFTIKKNSVGTNEAINADAQIETLDRSYTVTLSLNQPADKNTGAPATSQTLDTQTFNQGTNGYYHEFTVATAGAYELVLSASSGWEANAERTISLNVSAAQDPNAPKISAQVPSSGLLDKDVDMTVQLVGGSNLLTDLKIQADWGDGTKDDIEVDTSLLTEVDQDPKDVPLKILTGSIPVQHKFLKTGPCKIVFTISGQFNGATLTSPTVNKSIQINEEGSGSGTEDSEPKTDDGKSGDASSASTPKSGEGQSTDTGSTGTTQKSKAKAKPAASTAPATAAQSETKAAAVKPTETAQPERIDIALDKISTSKPINLGKEETVLVKIKNNASREIERCEVSLTAQGGFSEKQEVALKKKELKSVKFVWTPDELGEKELNAAFVCKGDETPDNNEARVTVEVVEKPLPASKSTGTLKKTGAKKL